MPRHIPAATVPGSAWECLRAGIPLTLLLDLAAGESLDSAAVLRDEQLAALAAEASAELDRGRGSAWTRSDTA